MTTFALVSVADAKLDLGIPSSITDFDAHVTLKIRDASAIAMKHMKLTSLPDEWNEGVGSPSGTGVPYNVQCATRLMVAELYVNREAGEADVLSSTVKSLLAGYRDPTIA